MPKVLISDKLSDQAIAVFKQKGIEVDVRTDLTPAQLLDVIGDYDALAIRSATKVTADVLGKALRLKVVGRAGIGVDNVDIPAATAKGIIVMNTPFGNSITTAEHAIALMLSLARDVPTANASTHAGKWEKNRFMGVEITGKTLGIIGCGNIGSIVAERARGLKMQVIAFDPFLTEDRARSLEVERVDLDMLLARADFITLHTPLNDKTRNILNAAAFKKAKKGVRIINCARGGLIVEDDLKAALDSGHVAGAALDVFEIEPAKQHALFGNEKVIATPHLGASTTEAQENVAVQVAEQIADYLLTGAITNAVNMPSVSGEEAVRLKPYLTLANVLGGFVGQVTQSSIKSVSIEYGGEASRLNTRILTSTMLAALLAPSANEVNVVNAGSVAKERGIAVSEIKTDRAGDYPTSVRLTVHGEKTDRSLRGTVFGGTTPRLVEVEGVPIDASLGHNVLFVRNLDKPGFIGRVGTALSDAGINIASFHLGRIAANDSAICLIEVDQPLTPALLAKVKALPNVVEAYALRF
ncbi:MAG: phosphoglycerate dehydrogenase [Holosporales bacterium]|jgi:D-3-phosphoglycerate dehydrogenase